MRVRVRVRVWVRIRGWGHLAARGVCDGRRLVAAQHCHG